MMEMLKPDARDIDLIYRGAISDCPLCHRGVSVFNQVNRKTEIYRGTVHCSDCGLQIGSNAKCRGDALTDALALWDRMPRGGSAPASRADMGEYQAAVGKWMVEVFGEEIAMDPLERIMRFLEEALELAQAEGMTAEEVGRVVDYVYGRPTGETFQEVGGVMVTLAAFCFRRGVDLKAAALTESDRIDSPEMRLRVFEKQAFKRAQGLTSDGGFRGEGAA